MLVLINALTLRSAIGRIALDLGGGAGRAVRLIAAIKARHPGLAGAFHTGAGLRLMRLDADIADEVFARLLRRGIVALGSMTPFIASRKNEGDLRTETRAI